MKNILNSMIVVVLLAVPVLHAVPEGKNASTSVDVGFVRDMVVWGCGIAAFIYAGYGITKLNKAEATKNHVNNLMYLQERAYSSGPVINWDMSKLHPDDFRDRWQDFQINEYDSSIDAVPHNAQHPLQHNFTVGNAVPISRVCDRIDVKYSLFRRNDLLNDRELQDLRWEYAAYGKYGAWANQSVYTRSTDLLNQSDAEHGQSISAFKRAAVLALIGGTMHGASKLYNKYYEGKR